MADLFAGYNNSFLDWEMNAANSPVNDGTYSQPNGASVPVNRPAVDTGGTDWGSWFDRIVGTAVTLRNSSKTDAQITAYPGGSYAYAGQPTGGTSNMFPLLVLGGMALAAYLLMKS